jgi:hypothetical protein
VDDGQDTTSDLPSGPFSPEPAGSASGHFTAAGVGIVLFAPLLASLLALFCPLIPRFPSSSAWHILLVALLAWTMLMLAGTIHILDPVLLPHGFHSLLGGQRLLVLGVLVKALAILHAAAGVVVLMSVLAFGWDIHQWPTVAALLDLVASRRWSAVALVVICAYCFTVAPLGYLAGDALMRRRAAARKRPAP